MIVPNIEDESNYSPICTAFQWKFNPADVKSNNGIDKSSPPFYNIMNAQCFQLVVDFQKNNFNISFYRYRGKYDHNVNEMWSVTMFDFQIHVLGQNGKLKIFEFHTKYNDYSIPKFQMRSKGMYHKISNGEINSLTVDGYVHLHCFFNKVHESMT